MNKKDFATLIADITSASIATILANPQIASLLGDTPKAKAVAPKAVSPKAPVADKAPKAKAPKAPKAPVVHDLTTLDGFLEAHKTLKVIQTLTKSGERKEIMLKNVHGSMSYRGASTTEIFEALKLIVAGEEYVDKYKTFVLA